MESKDRAYAHRCVCDRCGVQTGSYPDAAAKAAAADGGRCWCGGTRHHVCVRQVSAYRPCDACGRTLEMSPRSGAGDVVHHCNTTGRRYCDACWCAAEDGDGPPPFAGYPCCPMCGADNGCC